MMEMPLITIGRIRQYQSRADIADITMTSGNTWKAKVASNFGLLTSKGVAPPPR